MIMHSVQEVESNVLSQAAMRAIGGYEMGWLQALVAQDVPDQAPRLAFAAQADEAEGTQGGIFIGGVPFSCTASLLYNAGIVEACDMVQGAVLPTQVLSGCCRKSYWGNAWALSAASNEASGSTFCWGSGPASDLHRLLCRRCEAVRAEGSAVEEGHLCRVCSREPAVRRLRAGQAHGR